MTDTFADSMTTAEHIVEWGMNDRQCYDAAVTLQKSRRWANNATLAMAASGWVRTTYHVGKRAGDLPDATVSDLLDAAKLVLEREL